MIKTGLQYRYGVQEHDADFDNAYEIESVWVSDIEHVAKQAAENYHSNHDGWECSWPLTFIIWDLEGIELGRFSVDRDYDPIFYARQIGK